MLEIFILLVALVLVLTWLDRAPLTVPVTTGLQSLAAKDERPQFRLAIPDTQRLLVRNKSFVKGFGVPPHAVHDIRTYAAPGGIEDFPATLAAQLRELYARGGAVGTEIMALLCHGRGLKAGEAVYFALVDSRPQPRVVAFVDKVRGRLLDVIYGA
jgi:hypothetical protein